MDGSADARSPTLEILLVITVVFILQQLIAFVSQPLAFVLFTLQAPVLADPWALVTSVYAHSGVDHLLANAIALAVVGFLLERHTTRARFHVFFLTTGVAAGVFQIGIASLFGVDAALLGASGAVFGLIGYLVTGNRLSGRLFDRIDLSGRATLAIFILLAVLVTLVTAAPGVALAAHFFGFLLGLVAGQLNLLRPPRNASLK
ncbi:rhomboid family intramembrane serine protease [Natranaeroarchaeum sulfidigenes]|uniref:rhomboid family intramembrane serine protease n=1 Tax=Natranaeroarchaeum sulfidigenes TaxID=2784880 RepID=UPI001EE50A68|nr:rhomboid family intramembrane serine protease [Natranaeroarchaeum sulfidigenes]